MNGEAIDKVLARIFSNARRTVSLVSIEHAVYNYSRLFPFRRVGLVK